jgi:hypothetical protein
MSTGNGLMHPLAAAARKAGVEILVNHRMTAIHRETPRSGPVLGIAVDNDGKTLNIRAHKAVIIGTGGSTSNVNFRRMFDPRLTEEYCGAAGQPWSTQDASGELAGLAIGASLAGAFNYTAEFGDAITKAGSVGAQYIYVNLRWYPGSEVFDKARAIGLHVDDWQDLVLVNMLGKRFYDETARQFTAGNFETMLPYAPHNWRNGRNLKFNPNGFSMRRWPASATPTMAAARSGRSSTPMRSPAKNGIRNRPMSMTRPASSSPPTRSRTWPRKS